MLYFGGWALWRRPRVIVGADRLQVVEGRDTVKVEIMFVDVDVIELCKPGWGATPFIGVRFSKPKRCPPQILGQPTLARRNVEKLGYHWSITQMAAAEPLANVLEKIKRRLRTYHSNPPRDTDE